MGLETDFLKTGFSVTKENSNFNRPKDELFVQKQSTVCGKVILSLGVIVFTIKVAIDGIINFKRNLSGNNNLNQGYNKKKW